VAEGLAFFQSLFFYKVGKFVGARPLISVLLALVFTALCGSVRFWH
jgi:uncharacterized membrane protein YdfJ with MMPL/SSD domain